VHKLGELFASFSKGEKAEALKAFLVREGFVEKEQIKSIDWPAVIKKLITSDFFPTMLIRGKNLARMSF
jgi:transketolase N-terminal domain/subunit